MTPSPAGAPGDRLRQGRAEPSAAGQASVVALTVDVRADRGSQVPGGSMVMTTPFRSGWA